MLVITVYKMLKMPLLLMSEMENVYDLPLIRMVCVFYGSLFNKNRNFMFTCKTEPSWSLSLQEIRDFLKIGLLNMSI